MGTLYLIFSSLSNFSVKQKENEMQREADDDVSLSAPQSLP